VPLLLQMARDAVEVVDELSLPREPAKPKHAMGQNDDWFPLRLESTRSVRRLSRSFGATHGPLGLLGYPAAERRRAP